MLTDLKYPWKTLAPMTQTSPWPLEAQYSMSGISTSFTLLHGSGGPTWHSVDMYRHVDIVDM